MVDDVLLIEVTAGEKRNAKRVEPTGCDDIRGRAFPLGDRRNVALRTRVECGAAAIEERESSLIEASCTPGVVRNVFINCSAKRVREAMSG